MTSEQSAFTPRRIRYKKGENILKQGDYGISIYRVLRGSVEIYREAGEGETRLAVLTPGEVIGEMTFLSNTAQVHSASARALDNSELEVWHPQMLKKEYEQMPPIIKYMANQVVKRLIRMNKLIARLGPKSPEASRGTAGGGTQETRRAYYRKEVHIGCTYRPLGALPGTSLSGHINDISMTGLGLVVRARNLRAVSHEKGQEFLVLTRLPNGKEIELQAKVVHAKRADRSDRVLLGMAFTELKEWSRKALGFFLMP